MITTRQQRESLYRLYTRNSNGSESYLAFRRRARLFGFSQGDTVLGIQWCGMFIGIEKDGHSHS